MTDCHVTRIVELMVASVVQPYRLINLTFPQGTPLHKIQLDSYTVTEVLRLHLLGAGGRVNGANYYGRWRFNHRGMFSDHDDPCIELRNRVIWSATPKAFHQEGDRIWVKIMLFSKT